MIFLAANALSDAFSIQLPGLQDTSLQPLIGKVTDVCRVPAKCEVPTLVAGWESMRSPALPEAPAPMCVLQDELLVPLLLIA